MAQEDNSKITKSKVNKTSIEVFHDIKETIKSQKNSIMNNDLYKSYFFGNAPNKEELAELIIKICHDHPNVKVKEVTVEEFKNYVFDEDNNLKFTHGFHFDLKATTDTFVYYIFEFQKENKKDDVNRFTFK